MCSLESLEVCAECQPTRRRAEFCDFFTQGKTHTRKTTIDWRHENHDGCEEEPLDRQQEHPKQIAQRKTNIVTQPKMQRTKLPSMPTGEHIKHIDRQQHQNPFRKNTELQITKRYLFMAMPTLQTSKTK